MKFKKDTRDKFWQKLEAKIQKIATKKDKLFSPSGKWKKLIKKEKSFKVFSVNGEWVRANLSVIFGHGGSGLVHEFIPIDEIWVATHHPKDCSCRKVKKNRKMSLGYRDSTILHEMTECGAMKKGIIFWKAHQIALQAEIKAEILKDPYSEI
ncbi:MAG: hypothetical protein AAB617_02760 [Patescibacteria group bacterium]